MRIVDIKEAAVPLNSSMRNAAFDFSEMTKTTVCCSARCSCSACSQR